MGTVIKRRDNGNGCFVRDALEYVLDGKKKKKEKQYIDVQRGCMKEERITHQWLAMLDSFKTVCRRWGGTSDHLVNQAVALIFGSLKGLVFFLSTRLRFLETKFILCLLESCSREALSNRSKISRTLSPVNSTKLLTLRDVMRNSYARTRFLVAT